MKGSAYAPMEEVLLRSAATAVAAIAKAPMNFRIKHLHRSPLRRTRNEEIEIVDVAAEVVAMLVVATAALLRLNLVPNQTSL